jgi:hypothetical protein
MLLSSHQCFRRQKKYLKKDVLRKEIGLSRDFGYALRKENRILFEDMLDGCKKKSYVDCAANKGENFSTEALF